MRSIVRIFGRERGAGGWQGGGSSVRWVSSYEHPSKCFPPRRTSAIHGARGGLLARTAASASPGEHRSRVEGNAVELGGSGGDPIPGRAGQMLVAYNRGVDESEVQGMSRSPYNLIRW